MTLHVVQHEATAEHRSFRLTRPSASQRSEARPDVVVPADRARRWLAEAARLDVARGGHLSAGPSGIQVWSGPWDAADGRAGSARHLGSVDWSWDQPVGHYVTVYRVLLTAAGASTGLSTDSVLDAVLAIDGLGAPPAPTARTALPLPRDPFRRETWAALTDDTARR